MQKVIVIGQGYVGLPVAVRAAEAGFDVIGFDVDAGRVQRLANGESFIEDITDARLGAVLSGGHYRPSADPADLAGFDVAVISVPTPLREGIPDLSYIESAAQTVAPHVTAGCTVVLESTTYPGSTEELVAPVLEAASGMTAGVGFHLGYSPERIDPGNEVWTFERTPKIVSGVSPASLVAVQGFYDRLVDKTVPVSSPKEAELAKLIENTFRRPLPAHRPVVPLVAGPAVARAPLPVRGARQRRQRAHARLRGPADHGGPEPSEPAGPRPTRPPAGPVVQEEHR